MAQRIVKWTIAGSVLQLHKYLNDKSDVVLQASFDIADIFAEFLDMTDVQKYLTINGIKQRLMDCGASEVGNADGKVVNAKKIWAELLEGKITGERVNANNAKTQRAEAYSALSLMTKKLKGETLTDAEETFLSIVMERVEKK